jgi:hypothetical protein
MLRFENFRPKYLRFYSNYRYKCKKWSWALILMQNGNCFAQNRKMFIVYSYWPLGPTFMITIFGEKTPFPQIFGIHISKIIAFTWSNKNKTIDLDKKTVACAGHRR